ncbi:hypothetical protein HAX54_007792 [Datura stramonium]|uniref:Uncharacterized protein n=1 Tax=Datura stramonium TaxID=4076 RepID=A0ABS8RI26_DATST|nr:hypothetical protein [Datura stramonium]
MRYKRNTKNRIIFQNLIDLPEVPCQATIFSSRENLFDSTSKEDKAFTTSLCIKRTRESNKNKTRGRSCVISPKEWFRKGKQNKLNFAITKCESAQKHRNPSCVQASISLMRHRRNTEK